MRTITLEILGNDSPFLLAGLLGAIALILLAVGVWHLVRRHRQVRYGVICLSAAIGPVGFVPAMLIDAHLHYRRGDKPGGRLAYVLAVVTAAITTLAAGGVVASGNSPGVFWMTALAIEVTIAIGVFYSAIYTYLGLVKLVTLMLLRSLTIVAFMLLLFKPVIAITVGASQAKPTLPILVDASQSMSVRDGAAATRYARATETLAALSRQIDEHFNAAWYTFATSLTRSDSADALKLIRPTGAGAAKTNIATAIRTTAADHASANVPGIILLTDGNASNADSAVVQAARKTGVPVYPVPIGSSNQADASRPNVEIVSVQAPFEAAKNNITNITVQVAITALPNWPVDISLEELPSRRVAAMAMLSTGKTHETLTAKLKYRPEDITSPANGADIRKLRIVVRPHPKETSTSDNEHELHLLITQPRIRVIYVEGSMRPEYKFLKRTLDSDPNVQFMSLVRLSGTNFSAYGSIEGKTLLRLPTTNEDFDLFDVLILGDLDKTYLGDARIARIAKFVRDGGGLLMIGGMNSFGPGGYGGTEIEKILPVLLGDRHQQQDSTELLPLLTAAGVRHAIFDGIAEYFLRPGGTVPSGERGALPSLRGCVSVVKSRPGANLLAIHPTRRNPAGPLVILATQQFVGEGRSAAFTPDTTWLWYMKMRGRGQASPYHRFWGQLIRWLGGKGTRTKTSEPSVLARSERSHSKTGDKISIVAKVLNSNGVAATSARVTCILRKLDLDSADSNTGGAAMAYNGDSGVFECSSLRPPSAGTYVAKVIAHDTQTDKPLGNDELTLHVAQRSDEMDKLACNEKLLQQLADRSGGRYTMPAKLGDLISSLARKDEAKRSQGPQITNYMIYNFAGLFVLIVIVATTEWALRIRWRLH